MTAHSVDRFRVQDEDPGFKYRWMNEKDRRMLEAEFQGWETVKDPAPPVPAGTLPPGQVSETPTGIVRKRGDLILMRMPKEQWEKTIHADKLEARERQEATVDTMVQDANEGAQRQLRNLGYRNVPKRLVFREDADPEIKELTQK